MTTTDHTQHEVQHDHSHHDPADGGHGGHDEHDGGHDKHAGHDPEMFRRLFWWNLVLAVPVLVFSDQIQDWFDYSIDGAWAAWVAPVIGTVVYLWGGKPFLAGGVAESPEPPARDDAVDRAGHHGRLRVIVGGVTGLG